MIVRLEEVWAYLEVGCQRCQVLARRINCEIVQNISWWQHPAGRCSSSGYPIPCRMLKGGAWLPDMMRHSDFQKNTTLSLPNKEYNDSLKMQYQKVALNRCNLALAISEAGVQSAFGTPQEYNNSNMDHGYILMYNRQVIPGFSTMQLTCILLNPV